MNNKAILLVDMDAFFASCHISKDKNLAGKPIVVSSPNNRSIIVTSSYEARNVGISTGMPLFKALKISDKLLVVKPDYKLYVDMSNEIFRFIHDNFSKKMEVVSIDECYIDVTNEWKQFGSVRKIADAIRDKVKNKFNLTCSIGVSTNKFLAKMASEMNKPNGTFVILPNEVENKLWSLPVKKMYGVGTVTNSTLLEKNINTIGELAKTDSDLLINWFGKRGLVLSERANGYDSDELNENVDESKQISNVMTLNSSTLNTKEIEEFYYELATTVVARLNLNFQKAKVITTIMKYEYDYSYEGFDKIKHTKHAGFQTNLKHYTNDLQEIFSVLMRSFYENWDGRPIYYVGVGAGMLKSSLREEKQVEFDFYNNSKEPEEISLNNLITKSNYHLYKDKIMTGLEFEKRVARKVTKTNAGISKIDSKRINHNLLLKKWKETKK